MESLNSNSQERERELQLTQLVVQQLHSLRMTRFEELELHLRDLYLNNSSHVVDSFKPAFRTFLWNLLEVNAKTCLEVFRTQFKEFFASKGIRFTRVKVDMESSGTKSDKQNTSSMSGNDADTDDAVIRPVNDQEPLVEVQLTAPHNVLANEPQHTNNLNHEWIISVGKVDSNTTRFK
ncbi:hypothetical protein Tco_1532021 [Tanacetum coccineum]